VETSHKVRRGFVRTTGYGFIDFPPGLVSTPCKTHTHRVVRVDDRGGLRIDHLTYNGVRCNGNICQGNSQYRRYTSHTIVR
jgi:hypothetical protein